MATVNNINNLKIQSISGSGSVNFGNTINIGAESNYKAVGGSSVIGDLGKNLDLGINEAYDPDVVDQP